MTFQHARARSIELGSRVVEGLRAENASKRETLKRIGFRVELSQWRRHDTR